MKIFLTDDGTATIICPECKTKAIRSITRHKNAQEIRRIKISCHCGHTFIVLLEKRQYYRKQLELQGRYICQQSDGTTKRGLLTVVDASQSGLRIKLNSKSDLKTA